MTEQGKKASATAAANKAKREAKEHYRRELIELMIMNLELVLKDETISSESRLKAVSLMDEFRKEFHF